MMYVKSFGMSDSLWERVQKQEKRWEKSELMRQRLDDSLSNPNMNSFLRTCVEVYVENLEAMTDEDLEIKEIT
jgi:hypothetical protein